MKRITCRADLDSLYRESNLPGSLLKAIETHFDQLEEAFDTENIGENFVVDNGHIFVIEQYETDRDLRSILTSWPEYGEIVGCGGNTVVKFVVMCDNDWFDTYFMVKGHHPVIENWIEPYLEA